MVLLLTLSLKCLAQSEEGLFAVFSTNQGKFTCRLHFKRAPRTVANFVSLAEGIRTWVDFQKPALSNDRYYDQTTFHRVIKDFVIQGGSPNGQGNDGPGYTFSDEFHPELKHDRAGILSMAKSSLPHSNGSQFFITLAATPWLDNVHSVFGEVTDGSDIVTAIGNTATEPSKNHHPIEPQLIHSVSILQVGAEAAAFDPLTIDPPLPTIKASPSIIIRTDSGLDIAWPAKENHIYYVFFSANLSEWTLQPLAPTGTVRLDDLLQNNPQQYFIFIESQRDPGIPE